MTISLNALSGKLLVSISLRFFCFFSLGFYLVLSFETYSFDSSFLLDSLVLFLCEIAMPPSLERMALCRR